ncbi:MAG: HyaD/HybD family hydrogenase maturation endopeptidase [Anaerolineae bacterium]
MSCTLILGVGNILMGDEGVGVWVIEHLQAHYTFPEEVQVLDGGTMGLDLLTYLEGVERLLVVDALDACQPPGTIVRLADDQIPAFLGRRKLSPHQIGLADLLSVASLRGQMPHQTVLIGVQPASLETKLGLSPTIQAQLPSILEKLLSEMESWGYQISVRSCPPC